MVFHPVGRRVRHPSPHRVRTKAFYKQLIAEDNQGTGGDRFAVQLQIRTNRYNIPKAYWFAIGHPHKM